jgi:CBS domain-containing protein
MTPREELVTVGPEDLVTDALTKITQSDVNQLPVLQGDQLEGLVSRRDILLWLRTHGEEEFNG